MQSIFETFIEEINKPFGAILLSITIFSLPIFLIMIWQQKSKDMKEREIHMDFSEDGERHLSFYFYRAWKVVWIVTLVIFGLSLITAIILAFVWDAWLLFLIFLLFPLPLFSTLIFFWVYFLPGSSYADRSPAFIFSILTRIICFLASVILPFYIRFWVVFSGLLKIQAGISGVIYFIATGILPLIGYVLMSIRIVKQARIHEDD